MPHVVTGLCDGCKFTDCVTVCPVDCFHEGPTMLYIDPVTCIDCDACVPQCPVEAIFDLAAVPEDQKKYIEINAEESKKRPKISVKKDPLPGAMEKKAAMDAAKTALPPPGRGEGGGGDAKGPTGAQIAAKRKQEQEEKRKKEEAHARIEQGKRERVARFFGELISRTQEGSEAPEDPLERDRRYGSVYLLEERRAGFLLRFEFPRQVPAGRAHREGAPAGEMPDYRHAVRLAAPDLLVVEGWVQDPRVRDLVGRAGSFPPGFRREIRLPRPVREIASRYRDKVLEVELH